MNGFELRSGSPEDAPFLRALFEAVRGSVFASLPSGQREGILELQFRAQETFYRSQFPDLQELIMVEGGSPVGRLALDSSGRPMRIVDLAVLPEAQGHGLGTEAVRHAQALASAAQTPLELTVEKGSSAEALYRKLGFEPIGTTPDDLRLEMRWHPTQAP